MFQRFIANTIDATQDGDLDEMHLFDAIASDGGMTLSEARKAHLIQLDLVNAEVAELTGGGILIGVPICPSACLQGKISDFLTVLQCNPFNRANMMYFASDAVTAEKLETRVYSADLDNLYDAEMVAFYKRAMQGWDEFKELSLDATRIDVLNHRDMFRKMICDTGAKIEKMTFPGKRNLWRAQFGEKIKVAA